MAFLKKRSCALLLALLLTLSLLGPLAAQAEAAEMKTAIGTVTASALRFRSAPTSSSEVLGVAAYHDKVVVIGREGDWLRVVFNLKTGYMHSDYLELDEVKNIKLGYARFDYPSNVRLRNSADSPSVGKPPRGDTCFIIGFNRGWYKVSYNGQLGYVRSDLVTMLEAPYENAGSAGNTFRVASGRMTEEEKLRMIFGTTEIEDPRLVYETEAEAISNMTRVTVKTWDLNSKGEKYTRTWTLTVNVRIASTVSAMFAEIYALDEKPVVHSMGGYRWCFKSEHSIGLAVDLNPVENYYIDPDGKLLSGKYFRPDSDPYSIPVDGSVDRIFAKYGFIRGIYWESGFKDYMHYSFFGT